MFIGTNNKGVIVLTKKDYDSLMLALDRMGSELDYIEKSTSVLLVDCKFDDYTRSRVELLNSSSREGLKWRGIADRVRLHKGC